MRYLCMLAYLLSGPQKCQEICGGRVQGARLSAPMASRDPKGKRRLDDRAGAARRLIVRMAM
jgi:hypothetical protein